jgi:ribosomal protein L37AE/L43A
MAVVVLNFIPKGKTAKAQALETLGYNGTRPGREEEEIDRKLFGHGGEYTSDQALQMIDEAPANTYFWRLIVSPDPNSENKDRNLDLRLLTTQMVDWLETRLNRDIPFIGAEHNDHTDIPHIHAIALIQRRGREMLIDRAMTKDLIKYATKMSLEQQKDLSQEIELNVLPAVAPAVQKPKENHLTQPPVFIARGEAKQVFKHSSVKRLPQQAHSCSNCQARQSVIKLKSGVMWCKTCKKVQKENQLTVDVDRGFELSL